MRLVFLFLMLALAGCGKKAASGVKVDPALDTLVPADTVLLVGTRLESLLKTPVYQNHFANRDFPQIEEFARRTGIDPRKDLWELLYVSNGQQGVLLARGKFGDEMMEPNLTRQGVDRFFYKGLSFYGTDRGAVVLLSPTVAAAADLDSLRTLVDRRGTSSGPPPPLAQMMKQIPAQAQFWAAYSGGLIHLPFEANSPLGNLNKLVASVESGWLYFDLREGLNGVIAGDCASDQDAQQVQGALRALIGIGRLSVPANQPDLAQVYDAIRVTQEGRRVKAYINVPQEMVDKFLGMWMQR